DGVASALYLLRRLAKEQDLNAKVVHVVDKNYSWVEELKEALYNNPESSKSNVWLVAEDCTTNGIIGMVNCLRREEGGEKIRCVFNA
ncbi:hypothetical protein, partial [Staphylococcus aureus]|uniref:hypothetical protein n=1 Tax=Staphylococcus aureus TaxID=1280 RepID=UPI0038B3FFF3